MNSKRLCTKTLLSAVAALGLQACDSDIDHTYLPSVAEPLQNPVIEQARQLINLPVYPANVEVQISLILRNLPDLNVQELAPGTNKVVLIQCSGGSCAADDSPDYRDTDHGLEYDGTFLTATAVGGGSLSPPPRPPNGGGINWAQEHSSGEQDTLGVAYDSQNTRLYATNTGRWLDFNGRPLGAGYVPSPGSREWETHYEFLGGPRRPERVWKTEPLAALNDALANDDDAEVHAVYFTPALFPLEFLPGVTCVTSDPGDPSLSDCIGAAFGQNTDPMYRSPPGQDGFGRNLGYGSPAAYGSDYDWIQDVYDVLVDSANDNAIFIVPAGDHGGEIDESSYGDRHQFSSGRFNYDRMQFDRYYWQSGWWAYAPGAPGVLPTTTHPRSPGKFTRKYHISFNSDLTAKLNELFFAAGVNAPTNIFAWVPAIADNPTNVLPVVAVNAEGSISDASSRCGEELADYCVAAPGFYFSVATTRPGPAENARQADSVRRTYQHSGGVTTRAGWTYQTVFAGGEVIGGCPEGADQVLADGATCAATRAGPRLMWVIEDRQLIRGDGGQFVVRELQAPSAPLNFDYTVYWPSPIAATEVAASIATGSVALVNAHFKSRDTAMSASDILERVRETADKTGVYADSSVYGQGLIDVTAAITPQGSSGIALTELARGATAPLDASTLALRSGLLGDALHRAFAGRTFIALDALHSPFRYSLGSLLRSRQSTGARLDVSAPLEHSVRRFADGSLLHVSRGSDQSVSMAFQQGGLGMHVASDTHPGLSYGSVAEGSGLTRAAALQADSALSAPWAASDRQWHSFGATVEINASQRLGISSYRALGRDASATRLAEDNPDAQDAVALSWQADFAGARFGLQHVRSQSADELLGIEVSGGLGGIADSRVDAANSWGLVELSARSRVLFSLWHLRARADNLTAGALASVDGLAADSWALALMLTGAANTDLTLRLEQPLRASSGTLHFNVPTGYTPDRRILFSALNADTTPSGRELRVQADFSVRLGERGGRLQLSAGQAHEPGHVRNADNDHYALIGLSLPL